MTVYVVVRRVAYEGGSFLSIHKTEKGAVNAAKKESTKFCRYLPKGAFLSKNYMWIGVEEYPLEK